MASSVSSANASAVAWRRPTALLRHAPRAVLWTAVLALAWAVVRPPLTLLAGMVRWQPKGSESLYFTGVGVGLALDLAFYAFLLYFLVIRRHRWAQLAFVAASLVQAIYWGSLLMASPGGVAPVPANFPAFANPPPVPRDVMYATSALLPFAAAIAALWPSVWRWTRRGEAAPKPAAAAEA